MIRWCAFCQKLQGEFPPFESLAVSHGICDKCKPRTLDWTRQEEDRIHFVAALQRRFWEAGKNSDTEEIDQVAHDGFAAGLRPIDMLYGLAGPALVEIGQLWEAGKCSVREEHRFTQTCEQFIQTIAQRVRTQRQTISTAHRSRVLLAQVDGNSHQIGLKFVHLGLASLGISSDLITPGVPPAEVQAEVSLAGGRPYHSVGLSIAIGAQLEALKLTIELLQKLKNPPKIFVGGWAIKSGQIRAKDVPGAQLIPDLGDFEARLSAFSEG